MIGLSPLTTAHPSTFQRKLVRTSTKFYLRFILAMVSSISFGSIECNYSRVSHSLSLRLLSSQKLTSLHPISRRIIMQKAHSQAFTFRRMCIALPSPVSSLVSGSISLPSPGFFSIFPYGTCSLSVDGEYLALGDGSPRFSPGSTYQAILEQKPRKTVFFRLQDYHLLGCAVPGTLTKKQLCNFLRSLQGTTVSLATP